MTIPTPVEFWTLNNTRVGAVAGYEFLPGWQDNYIDPGKIGQGWLIGPTNQYPLSSLSLTDPGAKGLNPSGAFTAVCWHKREVLDPTMMTGLLVWQDTGFRHGLLGFEPADPRTIYAVLNGSLSLSGSCPFDTNWHCFVLRHDGANTLSLFIDNVRATASVGPPTGTPATFGVGIFQPTYGSVDTIGYWNVALSDDEAAALYNSGAGWEYTPSVASVVTNILLGSTPETCRILDSRIVRGPI